MRKCVDSWATEDTSSVIRLKTFGVLVASARREPVRDCVNQVSHAIYTLVIMTTLSSFLQRFEAWQVSLGRHTWQDNAPENGEEVKAYYSSSGFESARCLHIFCSSTLVKKDECTVVSRLLDVESVGLFLEAFMEGNTCFHTASIDGGQYREERIEVK